MNCRTDTVLRASFVSRTIRAAALIAVGAAALLLTAERASAQPTPIGSSGATMATKARAGAAPVNTDARPIRIHGRAVLEDGSPAAGAAVNVLGTAGAGMAPGIAGADGWFEAMAAGGMGGGARLSLVAILDRDDGRLLGTWEVEAAPPSAGGVEGWGGVVSLDGPIVLRSTCEPEWTEGFTLTGLDVLSHAVAVFDDGTGPALYAGGVFTTADGISANRIARWNGQWWSSLGTGGQNGLNERVLALAVFDDGTGPALYAGGGFTTAGGIAANYIARWNGQAWSSLGTGGQNGVNSSSVTALAVFDDGTGPALYAGGGFTTAGGISANRIARWNGQSWSSLGSGGQNGVSGGVTALAVFDDGTGPALYAGGGFTTAGGILANSIARWNGQAWSSLGTGSASGVGGFVYALAVFNDGTGQSLYVGGDFPIAGGILANNIARWNGQAWSSLGTGGQNGVLSVTALAVFDDGTGPALYVGGYFQFAGGILANNIARWNGQWWSSFGSGGQNGVNGNVTALAVFDDGTGPALYAGGDFSTAGGIAANRIARWNGQSWSSLGSGGQNGVSGGVTALAVFDDGTGPALYAGGDFSTAGGIAANRIARWNGQSWSSLGSGGQNGVSGGVTALAVFDDGTGPALYAGGGFTTAGGISANRIARWNGQWWSSLGTGGQNGLNERVTALAVFDDGTGPAMYVGGSFTAAGGMTANRIARWNGQAWSSLGTGGQNGVSGGQGASLVSALAVFDYGTGPSLYVGGNFTTAGNFPSSRLARWNGQAWSGFPNVFADIALSDVFSLAVFNDGIGPALYVGGNFQFAGGISNRIARWNGQSWSSLGSGGQNGVSGRVTALAVFDDGTGPALYVGGNFTAAGGMAANRIARWNGQSWSSLGSGGQNGVSGSVSALAVFDDGTGPALYAGGFFTSAGGIASSRIARWGCPNSPPPVQSDLLIVDGMVSSSAFMPGDQLEASVQVRNAGPSPFAGQATLALRLSRGSAPSPTDQILTVQFIELDLGADASAVIPLTFPAPGNLAPGEFTVFAVLVAPTADPNPANNRLAIGDIAVAPAAAGPLNPAAFVLAPGQQALFAIERPADTTTLRAAVASSLSAIEGVIDLFAGPSPSIAPAYAAFSSLPAAAPSQSLDIPAESSPLPWYLLVRARSTNTHVATCSLTIASLPLAIFSIDRSTLGDVASTTLQVTGADFRLGTTSFALRPWADPGAPAFVAAPVAMQDSRRAAATFDLRSASPGAYQLIAWDTASGHSTQFASPLDVVSAPQLPGGGLIAQFNAPSRVAINRTYPLSFDYSNEGYEDLPAPIFVIRGTNGLHREVVARGRSGQIDVMLPGEPGDGVSATDRQAQVGTVTYTVTKLAYAGQPFDWAAFEANNLPDGFPATDWALAVASARAAIGENWEDVLRAVRRASPGRSVASRGEIGQQLYALVNFILCDPDSDGSFGPRGPVPTECRPTPGRLQTTPGGTPFYVPGPPVCVRDRSTVSCTDCPTLIVSHGWCGPGGTGSGCGRMTIEGMVNAAAQAALAEGRPVRILEVDWDSVAPANPFRASTEARDFSGPAVAQLLREMGVTSGRGVTFAGHSFGNLIGQQISDSLGGVDRFFALDPAYIENGFRANGERNFVFRADSIGDEETPRGGARGLTWEIAIEDDGSGSSAARHGSGPRFMERWLSGAAGPALRQRAINWLFGGSVSELEDLPRGGPGEYGARLTAEGHLLDGMVSVSEIGTLLGPIPEISVCSTTVQAVGSMDPNDISGPAGVGTENWITGEGDLLYTIRFENLQSATAPAQEVAIAQMLDPNLDPATLEFVAFSLGDVVYNIPSGFPTWTQRLDLRPTRGVYADATFDCDPASGLVTCYWAAVDPQTLALPADPFAGILPPNADPPTGEGWVAYRVRARPGLATGTRIDAQARIVFDLNDPIHTPAIFNTIDNTPPSTTIGSVSSSSPTTIRVPWSSVPQPGEGSLLEQVTLYASVNDGPFEPVASGGPGDTELSFAGSAFNRYRLLLIGTDAAGNVEVGEPSGLLPQTQCFDAVADDRLNAEDYFQFLNWYLAGDERADVNGDTFVDGLDATAAILGILGR